MPVGVNANATYLGIGGLPPKSWCEPEKFVKELLTHHPLVLLSPLPHHRQRRLGALPVLNQRLYVQV